MTKRTALEALRDDLSSEEALVDRLRVQEERRVAAYTAAADNLNATRRAIGETLARIDALRDAILAIEKPTGQEEEDLDAAS